MTVAISFNGVSQVTKNTPSGGEVKVAFGHLTTEENQDGIPAIAIQIKDETGDLVTQFALRPESFGTMIEAIKELYDEEFGDDKPV